MIYFLSLAAHAKLMCHTEVRLQDAIVAVSLVESSMQGSAILGKGVNILHSAFPQDADQEYSMQGTHISLSMLSTVYWCVYLLYYALICSEPLASTLKT